MTPRPDVAFGIAVRMVSPVSSGIALLVFLSLWLAIRNFMEMAAGDPSAVKRRVEEIARRKSATPVEEEPEGAERQRRGFPGLRVFRGDKSLRWFGALLERSSLDRSISLALERADLTLKPAEFLMGAAGVTAALGLAGAALARIPGVVVLGGLGLWAPFIWLKVRTNRRIKQFEVQLADALTMIANSLRSGYSLLQAMDIVAKEMPRPVSAEFGRVVQEAGFNVPLEDSLEALLKRVGSDDLDLLITAILIQRQVGGNLAEVLDRISLTIRERMRILGEVRTLTAQGRISGLIVSLLPVALCGVLTLMNREYMAPFFHHPLGKALLGVAVLMEVTGMLVVRKIVNIKV